MTKINEEIDMDNKDERYFRSWHENNKGRNGHGRGPLTSKIFYKTTQVKYIYIL